VTESTGLTKVDFILCKGGSDTIEVTVRRALPSDIERMHTISQPYVAGGQLISRDQMLFATRVNDFHVVEIDREVVACAGIRRFGDIAEIFNVLVTEGRQGFGIGRLLLGSMMVLIAEQRFTKALVFSKGSTEWFGRFGFEPIDPATLPPERIAMIDPERASSPMVRDVISATDGVDALTRMTELRVRFDRSDIELPWDSAVEALLPFAEQNAIEISSLCWGGLCGTCSTPLKRGSVNYFVQPEIEPEPGEVLLCIARPVTDLVLDL
jgi:N-acetylglutamate synthase-like GNAT family acetyltransferase/ferredoxin